MYSTNLHLHHDAVAHVENVYPSNRQLDTYILTIREAGDQPNELRIYGAFTQIADLLTQAQNCVEDILRARRESESDVAVREAR